MNKELESWLMDRKPICSCGQLMQLESSEKFHGYIWRCPSCLRFSRLVAAGSEERPETEREPKMQRWFPLKLGLWDTRTGDIVPFKSVRDAARRLAVVQKYYLCSERQNLV